MGCPETAFGKPCERSGVGADGAALAAANDVVEGVAGELSNAGVTGGDDDGADGAGVGEGTGGDGADRVGVGEVTAGDEGAGVVAVGEAFVGEARRVAATSVAAPWSCGNAVEAGGGDVGSGADGVLADVDGAACGRGARHTSQ